MFDVRFWGPVIVAQNAKIRSGGSLTLTIGELHTNIHLIHRPAAISESFACVFLGSVIVKPHKTWSITSGVVGATDSLTRGLAVDLAPIRVNVISPGYVRTVPSSSPSIFFCFHTLW
jgi:NAD(P)-dependent dehydrogenase (short-subunit alcohol dehydrogenase family)